MNIARSSLHLYSYKQERAKYFFLFTRIFLFFFMGNISSFNLSPFCCTFRLQPSLQKGRNGLNSSTRFPVLFQSCPRCDLMEPRSLTETKFYSYPYVVINVATKIRRNGRGKLKCNIQVHEERAADWKI